ncbi:MAG: hypothetical protein H7177_10985 [Rhizobacter sp.]|nr:hypothetical protein [Bacteriovorax sp.]
MKKLSFYFNHLVVLCSLTLASCGYISDKPVENADVYRTDELQTCKIDVSKLAEIFKANQTDQIRCLQENFVQFTKYVRAKHPGSVSQDELGIFVKRFFEGQSDAIINGISLIFQLNMILLKDEADRISHQNISPLFELLIKVNQEAVILTNIIKAMDEPNSQAHFWELRKQFYESTNRFAAAAVGVIEKAPGFGQKLNMRQFVLDMSSKIGDHQIDEDTIDSFIFMKKMLVGGDEEVITTAELKDVISRLPKMLGLVFDVYYVKGENFKNDAAEMRFYLFAIRDVYGLIKFNQPDFELVNSKQLVKIAERFLKNYDVESFKPSIEALKARFIGGRKDSVSLKDMDTVLSMLHDFFEKIYFNHLTYDEKDNAKLLNSNVKLDKFDQKAIAGYEDFTPARVNQMHSSFADTAVMFRYFRDSSGAAIYGKDIKRNKKGFIEVNIEKWLSWKLLKAYGHVDAKNQMQLSMDEFSKFLLDSKPLLMEFKLWSPNFQTFSRNAVLLADLFQSRSDGDQQINIDEATEYIGMILSAVEVSNKYSNSLSNKCDPGINSEDPVFESSCYNENFYNVILKDLKFNENFLLLNNYLVTTSVQEGIDYLTGVEGFARDINDPAVPVNGRDSTLILGSMLNIESTFIRFDKNFDNVIDYNELNDAFLVYKNSIISLANLKGSDVEYAKGIFMYMASKMEVPKVDGIWLKLGFAKFNYCVNNPTGILASLYSCKANNEAVFAKRLNIGKLLYYMVNQPTQAVPVFKK